ncbi:hypothetical protein DL762_004409 [Monosporascus cannonballus]|uniref:SNF2 N-terminal domain-containing protein n=1 Tax=Monosporascus cannonballus TaxID=155416 RepID=A0ABY0HCE7_9PEZI|nr:hypothetical protein DL762_004409 [Monosporascus cannonballus]
MEQRPVEPKRVINLSADDNAFPSYDTFTEPYNGGWVDTIWTGTYELFGYNATVTEVKITDFKSLFNYYQAMCIFLLLTNPVRERVAGGLLADDMGLGKIIESLAIVVVRRRLLQSQNHVKDNPHRHLRENDQSTGKAKGNQKFVYRKDQVDSAARDKRGCFKEYDNGSLAYYFANEYIRSKGRFYDEITVGLVIMDEAHKYKGISSPTAPFVFLDKIRRYAITHFDETAAKQGWTHFSQYVHDWKSFANDENYIISRLHKMDNGKMKAELAFR